MRATLKPYAELNIIHTLNDDINIEFIRKTSNGTVIDITGYTYIFSIRETRGGTVVQDIPMVVTDALNGISVASESSININLESVAYTFDIQETAGGVKTTITKGDFIVEKE